MLEQRDCISHFCTSAIPLSSMELSIFKKLFIACSKDCVVAMQGMVVFTRELPYQMTAAAFTLFSFHCLKRTFSDQSICFNCRFFSTPIADFHKAKLWEPFCMTSGRCQNMEESFFVISLMYSHVNAVYGFHNMQGPIYL